MGIPMMDATRIYLFVFGLFTIAGGVIGFVKAKSIPSIVAGSVSGALLLGAGYLVGDAQPLPGLALGFVVSLLLAGRFIPSFHKTRAVMPGGFMAALSVGGAALTLLALFFR
jgi:uncharacterized membrane protein (UPF0136 family)